MASRNCCGVQAALDPPRIIAEHNGQCCGKGPTNYVKVPEGRRSDETGPWSGAHANWSGTNWIESNPAHQDRDPGVEPTCDFLSSINQTIRSLRSELLSLDVE